MRSNFIFVENMEMSIRSNPVLCKMYKSKKADTYSDKIVNKVESCYSIFVQNIKMSIWSNPVLCKIYNSNKAEIYLCAKDKNVNKAESCLCKIYKSNKASVTFV
jgi:uncharacterized protein YcgL (UPF0745 family)